MSVSCPQCHKLTAVPSAGEFEIKGTHIPILPLVTTLSVSVGEGKST